MSRHVSLKRKAQSGFNLIEVSLAIAICSIGLIALMGLIPTGTEASRRAADDTLACSLASDMLHWRRISPFTNSTYMPLDAPPLSGGSIQPKTYTYDAMGNTQTNDDGVTLNPFYTGPYFLTTYTITNNPSGSPADVARVVINIAWPALGTNRTQRIFVSDYARMH